MGTASIGILLLATATFVLGHFVLSSLPVRRGLVSGLGEAGFRILYSIAATVAFLWMLFAYGAAPFVPLWTPPSWAAWIPVLVMPFVTLLVVAAFTTRNVTAVGGEAQATAPDPAPGIMRVTRHPFLVGAALWALSHLAVNGDAASVILFGGILVLSVGGIAHIDLRRRATLGSGWGPVALTTSAVPFAALLSGRTRPDWAGIGLWRVAVALALYLALLRFHAPLFGVSPFPA